LPSIHGPTIALMLPPDGWRLEADLNNPGSQLTSCPFPKLSPCISFASLPDGNVARASE